MPIMRLRCYSGLTLEPSNWEFSRPRGLGNLGSLVKAKFNPIHFAQNLLRTPSSKLSLVLWTGQAQLGP